MPRGPKPTKSKKAKPLGMPGISEVDAFPIASRSRDAGHSRHRRDCVGGGPRAAEGHAAVFDGFQGKPISLRELLETVRQILDR